MGSARHCPKGHARRSTVLKDTNVLQHSAVPSPSFRMGNYGTGAPCPPRTTQLSPYATASTASATNTDCDCPTAVQTNRTRYTPMNRAGTAGETGGADGGPGAAAGGGGGGPAG